MYTPGDLPDKYKISEENKYKMKADELIERIKTINSSAFILYLFSSRKYPSDNIPKFSKK